MSGPVMRTCARRTGPPVSVDITRPRSRAVPVFGCRGPIPGNWTGISVVGPLMMICCCRASRW